MAPHAVLRIASILPPPSRSNPDIWLEQAYDSGATTISSRYHRRYCLSEYDTSPLLVSHTARNPRRVVSLDLSNIASCSRPHLKLARSSQPSRSTPPLLIGSLRKPSHGSAAPRHLDVRQKLASRLDLRARDERFNALSSLACKDGLVPDERSLFWLCCHRLDQVSSFAEFWKGVLELGSSGMSL